MPRTWCVWCGVRCGFVGGGVMGWAGCGWGVVWLGGWGVRGGGEGVGGEAGERRCDSRRSGDGEGVVVRTLMVSSGWPTMTRAVPPTPPSPRRGSYLSQSQLLAAAMQVAQTSAGSKIRIRPTIVAECSPSASSLLRVDPVRAISRPHGQPDPGTRAAAAEPRAPDGRAGENTRSRPVARRRAS